MTRPTKADLEGARCLVLRDVIGPDLGVLFCGINPGLYSGATGHHQVESFTVQRGRMGYQRLGGPEQFGEPGDTVTFAPGEGHRFWNSGPDDLHCTGYIEPADNVEYFLGEIFASAKRRGGTVPDPFDAAFLATRYRDEFTMVAIPAPVRRFVFPLLVAVGTVLGTYRKYADAPAPVRR